MSRADDLTKRRRTIEGPADRPTRQAVRSELPLIKFFPVQCVIRSQDTATGKITAQLVRGTDALSADESAVGLVEHPVAFGAVFDVKPPLGFPISFFAMAGLVVPLPETPEAQEDEELGASLFVCWLLPGFYVQASLKIPGAAFSAANAGSSEGGGV